MKWARSSTARASVAELARGDARFQQVTHRTVRSKAADQALGLADLAGVEMEPGLDGVDEGRQCRPIASRQKTTQIVDDREGRFEPVRRGDSHFVETADDPIGERRMVSGDLFDLRQYFTARDEFIAIGQDAERLRCEH